MRVSRNLFLFFGCCILFFGCGQAGDKMGTRQLGLAGAVEKGPFIKGSTVEVSVLNSTMEPTGQVFKTFTFSDKGDFEVSIELPENITGAGNGEEVQDAGMLEEDAGTVGSDGGTGSYAGLPPLSIEGQGYYYNEITGDLSTSVLTLRAYYVPESTAVQHVYVNIITHLTSERIKALVTQGLAFDDAVAQAETELHDQLNITVPEFNDYLSAVTMDVAGGDNDRNAYLLAVSSVIVKAAEISGDGVSVDARLQELLNNMMLELSGGELSDSTNGLISQALSELDTDDIEDKLAGRLMEIQAEESAPDMDRVLDQDHDGLANIDDNCKLVPNTDQADGDSDSQGDACDTCPSTPCSADCVTADTSASFDEDFCYAACDRYSADSLCADQPDAICAEVPILDQQGENFQVLQMCATPCDPSQPDSCPDQFSCTSIHDSNYGGEPLPEEFICLPTMLRNKGEGERCLNSDFCQYGMECQAGPKCETFGVTPCCYPVGGEGDPCPENGTCQDGLECMKGGHDAPIDTWAVCNADPSRGCCVATGEARQPCRADGSCDDGLDCMTMVPGGTEAYCNATEVRGCCVALGNERQPCKEETCNGPELRCLHDDRIDTQTVCGDEEGISWGCCMNVGSKDNPCNPDATCNDADLYCAMGYGTVELCSALPSTGCCVAEGEEFGPCFQDGTCDGESECLGGVCRLAGGTGEPCHSDGSCDDAGDECSQDVMSTDICGVDETIGCCLKAGTVHGVCLQDDKCADGLTCVDGLCMDPTRGGEGEPCNEDGSCDEPSLDCFDMPAAQDPLVCGSEFPCCIRTRGEGMHCGAGRTCDAGLVCANAGDCVLSSVTGCCMSPGGFYKPCYPDHTCDVGLTCKTDEGSLMTCGVSSDIGCCMD